MSRPVATHVSLKEALFIPNLQNGGSVGPSLPSRSLSLQDFKMEYDTNTGDVHMTWKEGKFLRTYIVSQSNIKGINLAPEAVTTDAKSE